MTLVSLRPTSTFADSGVVTGAASAHAALADDSDSSYVSYNAGGYSTLGLADLTLPAGAILRSAAVRVRVKRVGDAWSLGTVLNGIAGSERGMWVTWLSPTTVEMAPRITDGLSDALLDAASLFITSTLHVLTVYEAYLDVRYVELPDLEITAPTGTITNTNRPAVDWTPDLDSDGGAATSYEINIYTEADALGGFVDGPTWASGIVSGRTRIAIEGADGYYLRIPVVLADDDYRAYVRIAQIVNGTAHWSDWEYEAFTIDVVLPAPPTMLLTAEPASGRIKVTLDDVEGDTETDAYEVQRLDGDEWVAVRLRDEDGYYSAPEYVAWVAGPAVLYDYEAPNGIETMYRARALHDYTGSFAASDWTESSTTWQSTQWWLTHPHLPALNLPVEIASYREVTRAARQTALQPMGSSLHVVISDATRGGATGTVVLTAYDSDAQDALNALLDTTDTLLLHGPVEDGMPDRYVCVGDHVSSRIVDKSFSHVTAETLSWVQVGMPAGAQSGDQYTGPEDDGEELVVG